IAIRLALKRWQPAAEDVRAGQRNENHPDRRDPANQSQPRPPQPRTIIRNIAAASVISSTRNRRRRRFVANIINRGAWGIRRHNYLVRHSVQLVAETCTQPRSGCPILLSRSLRKMVGGLTSQCLGSVGGSVCITKSF